MVELTHEEHDVANIPSFVFVQRHNTNDWQLLNTNFQVLASWKLIRLDRRVHDDLGDHDEFIMIFPWKVTHHPLGYQKRILSYTEKKKKKVAVRLRISGSLSLTFYPFLWTTAEIWLGEKKAREKFCTSVLDALVLPWSQRRRPGFFIISFLYH